MAERDRSGDFDIKNRVVSTTILGGYLQPSQEELPEAPIAHIPAQPGESEKAAQRLRLGMISSQK